MAESGSFLRPGEIATSTYSADEETFERTPRDNTLCQRCEAFDIQALRLDHPLYARGYKVDDVKLSADRGCRFCTTLIEGLPIASRRGESPWGPNGPQVGEYIHFRAFRANEAGGLKEAVMQWWQTGPLGITHIAATVAAEPSPGFLDPRVNLILHATADLSELMDSCHKDHQLTNSPLNLARRSRHYLWGYPRQIYGQGHAVCPVHVQHQDLAEHVLRAQEVLTQSVRKGHPRRGLEIPPSSSLASAHTLCRGHKRHRRWVAAPTPTYRRGRTRRLRHPKP